MFMDLGHEVYRREFELQFLEVSADFYKVSLAGQSHASLSQVSGFCRKKRVHI